MSDIPKPLEGLEEHLEKFKEEWENANKVSNNLKWAIFPAGDKEVEFQAAKRLMALFDNLDGFIYFREDQNPETIMKALQDVLKEYKQRTKDKVALAAKKHDYELHLGS